MHFKLVGWSSHILNGLNSVEIYLYASQAMIDAANAGTLQ